MRSFSVARLRGSLNAKKRHFFRVFAPISGGSPGRVYTPVVEPTTLSLLRLLVYFMETLKHDIISPWLKRGKLIDIYVLSRK